MYDALEEHDGEVSRAISYLGDRVCSIFSGAGKFYLIHGLRQLTHDAKSKVSCLQMTLTRCTENSE